MNCMFLKPRRRQYLKVKGLSLSSLFLALALSLPGLAQATPTEKKPLPRQLDNPTQDNLARSQFGSLQQKLIDFGFKVKLEIPPHTNRYGRKPYGLVSSREKTVWINPVVFDLGNALPVLIHEAVHAAQVCAGDGNFSLLNLELEAPKIALPYFLRYHNLQRQLEAEAYIVQTQSNSLELATDLLDQHCLSVDQS